MKIKQTKFMKLLWSLLKNSAISQDIVHVIRIKKQQILIIIVFSNPFPNKAGQQVDSKNIFGDIQLDADIAADNIIFQQLQQTGLVAYGLSEQNPKVRDKKLIFSFITIIFLISNCQLIELGGQDFIVTFDPLDGSSIIGTNWTVGSIFGIWKNDERLLIGHQTKDMVGAGCAMYGPRLTLVTYNVVNKSVEEHSLQSKQININRYQNQQIILFIKTEVGETETWVKTKENIAIKHKGKVFSPGNLRASQENLNYKKCIDYWMNNGYTLRYTGGMVPDIYQIFIKNEGIFTTIGSKSHPAKLRVLYEVAPMAFLVEAAGGQTSEGQNSLMELEVTGYDQRSGIVVGSQEEVERVLKFLNEEK